MPATSLKLDQMSHVILFAKDTVKAAAFYRDVLGLEAYAESPGWVEFKTGQTVLALHQAEAVEPGDKKSAPQVCFTVADMGAAFALLKLHCVTIVEEPHSVYADAEVDVQACLFRDPDGNLLALNGIVKK